MPLRTALIAFVIAAAPTFASAMCAAHEEMTSTTSCAEGQTFDPTTQACVDQASS